MVPSIGNTIELRTDPYIPNRSSHMARQDDRGAYVVTILVVPLPNMVDFLNVGIFWVGPMCLEYIFHVWDVP